MQISINQLWDFKQLMQREVYLLGKVVLKLDLLVMAGSLGLPSLAQLFFCPDGSRLSSPLLPLSLVHLCTMHTPIGNTVNDR